jgi:hypothetical protein
MPARRLTLVSVVIVPAPTAAGRTPVAPLCSGLTEIFYSERLSDKRWAMKLCRSCPYQVPCLDAALHRREQYGVWGGRAFRSKRRGRQLPFDDSC